MAQSEVETEKLKERSAPPRLSELRLTRGPRARFCLGNHPPAACSGLTCPRANDPGGKRVAWRGDVRARWKGNRARPRAGRVRLQRNRCAHECHEFMT